MALEISTPWTRFRPDIMRELVLDRSEGDGFVHVKRILGYWSEVDRLGIHGILKRCSLRTKDH